MILVVKHLLTFILIVSIAPNFASANLVKDIFPNSDELQVNDSSFEYSSSFNDNAKIFSEESTEDESSEESATNTEMNQYQSNSNETYGCAYFLNESVGVYKSNYLYFYGYEIDELEKASSADKAIKCKWKNIHEDIPKEIKSSILCVVFDQSSKNIKPDNLNAAFVSFRNCESIEGLNYLNTSNVTNMKGMFRNCSLLSEINLENFDTSNVVNMSEMFTKNYNLKTIYVTELFSTEKVTKSDNMFKDCFALVGGNGTKYDPSYIDISAACIDKAGKLWGVDRGYLTCGKYTPQPPEKPEQKAAVENSTNENYESVATSPTT